MSDSDDQEGKDQPVRDRPDRGASGDDRSRDAGDREALSAWQVMASTLAAAFGVQSSHNRTRDFSRGKAVHFIAAGIVFTVVFVLGLILVVNLVLG